VPQSPAKKPSVKKTEAAFFDLDNTLLRGSSSFLFGKAAFERKFLSTRDFWRFALQQARFIWRGESKGMIDKIEDRALGLVEGHRVDELHGLIGVVFSDYIKPTLWPQSVALAQQHIKEGREVWIVTASPVEMGEHIANQLGLTGALGTHLEQKDGLLTGRLIGRPMHGKRKAKAIRELAKERNISLKRSFAYSDSVNDLPMLSRVGHPVAVNPDKALEKYAKAAGWNILDYKKREIRRHNKSQG
jgi:HAD superfamily hydrolase (TIGR01490 family)